MGNGFKWWLQYIDGPDGVVDGSIICTKTSARDNCNDCNNWRLIVWKDGASEIQNITSVTWTGYYFCGRSPCKVWGEHDFSDSQPVFGGIWGIEYFARYLFDVQVVKLLKYL